MKTNTDQLLENLNEVQLEFIGKYQEILSRVQVLQTRMAILAAEIESATTELEELRELEQKTTQDNGKK